VTICKGPAVPESLKTADLGICIVESNITVIAKLLAHRLHGHDIQISVTVQLQIFYILLGLLNC
jgi:hypothetical protein